MSIPTKGAPSGERLYEYQVSVRGAGASFLCSAIVAIPFFWWLVALDAPAPEYWAARGGITLFFSVFLAVGVHLIFRGGTMGCWIDHERLCWHSPFKAPSSNGNTALPDIQEFTIVTQAEGDTCDVRTHEGRYVISSNCIGNLEHFVQALATGNPSIKFVMRADGAKMYGGSLHKLNLAICRGRAAAGRAGPPVPGLEILEPNPYRGD